MRIKILFILLCCISLSYGQENDSIFDMMMQGKQYKKPDRDLSERKFGEIGDTDFFINIYPSPKDKTMVEDTVSCTLSFFFPDGNNQPIKIVLECNEIPDRIPPTLIIEGKALKVSSKTSTLSILNGVEHREYGYEYVFYPPRLGQFICRTEGLSFKGISYDTDVELYSNFYLKNPNNDISNDADNSSNKDDSKYLSPDFILIILFIIIAGVSLWLYFRKESNSEFALFVLKTKRVPLTFGWALTHYGASIISFVFPSIFIIVDIYQYILYSKAIQQTTLWISVAFISLGIILWRWQKKKLYFKEFKTSLEKEEIFNALVEVGEQKEWTFDYVGGDCLVIHTNPKFPVPSWGEQIFVVFDDGCVWINSVCDLNKRASLTSFGRTKRNIQTVKDAIAAKEQSIKEKEPKLLEKNL